MTKPTQKVLLPPEKFPLKMQLYSGDTTNELLWERTVTLAEAEKLSEIEIPSFKDTRHYPVRAEIHYADGTTDIGGMS